jgi:hypothetical protein
MSELFSVAMLYYAGIVNPPLPLPVQRAELLDFIDINL